MLMQSKTKIFTKVQELNALQQESLFLIQKYAGNKISLDFLKRKYPDVLEGDAFLIQKNAEVKKTTDFFKKKYPNKKW
jgi:alpha-glucuronidase